MQNSPITQQFLRSIFEYSELTGKLIWKKRPRDHFKTDGAWKAFNTRYHGKEFGYVYSKGSVFYRQGEINGNPYQTHRLIFLYAHGVLPQQVDHIDHNGLNNTLLNLRATNSQGNGRNRPTNKNNKSGVTGVSWMKKLKKWRSYITVDNKQINLGTFDSLEAAKMTRKAAEIEYGFHPNHGESRRDFTDASGNQVGRGCE